MNNHFPATTVRTNTVEMRNKAELALWLIAMAAASVWVLLH